MNNNQQIAGSANIISGVHERVGMPVEAFKEVGAILTQRYYQNKQAHDSITTSLKNMQTIDDEVDKQMLAERSKVVDESFKRVVETDNYHNATSTVMDVSKFLTTDEGIKGLRQNTEQYSADLKTLKEGYKDNPNWRLYESTFTSRFKEDYRKKGGSVDANGNAQTVRMRLPTTDMDTSTEVKRIEEVVTKMEAFISTNFTNQQYVDKTLLDQIEDPFVRKSLEKLSEDKVKIKERSIPRMREAAIKVLEADPDFRIKKMEIIEAEHRRTTGTDNVTVDMVSNYLSQRGNEFERNISISLSPTYKAMLEDLKSKYEPLINSTDVKISTNALKEFNNQIDKLKKNDAIYKEGHKEFLNLKEDKLKNLYFGFKDSDITASVVSTVDAFRIYEKDIDREYFEPKITEALLAERAESLQGRATMNDATSKTLEFNIESLNPNSEASKEFFRLEAAATEDKGRTPELKFAYEKAKSARDSQIKTLLLTYEGFDPDTKKGVHTASWSILDDLSQAAFSKDKDTRYSKNFVINLLSGNKVATASMSGNTLAGYILENIKPKDLLQKSSSQLVNEYINPLVQKYSKNKQLGLNTKQELIRSLEATRNKFANAIYEKADGKIIRPTTSIVTLGTPTQASQLERINVVQSAFTGALTDLQSGTILDLNNLEELEKGEYVGYDKIDKQNLTQDDINNMAEVSVNKINTNGVYRGRGYTYNMKLPVFIKDDNGKEVFQRYIEKEVIYSGNNAISEEGTLSELNRLKKYIRPGNPSYTDAKETAHQLTTLLGSQVFDNTGVNIEDRLVELGRYGNRKFTKDIPLTTTNNGMNGSFIRVIGQDGRYDVEHITRVNGTNKTALKYNTAHLRDIVGSVGTVKAMNMGLDSELTDILINDRLFNSK